MRSFAQFLAEDRIDPKSYNVKALYDGLNNYLFGGSLPDIPVSFGTDVPKGATGITRYSANTTRVGNRVLNRVTIPGSIRMTIRPYSFEPEGLNGIMAHEMVHAWCAHTNHHERDTHGMFFMAKLGEVQRKANFKIPVKDEAVYEEKGEAREVGFIAGLKTGNVKAVALLSRAFVGKADSMLLGQSAVDMLVTKRGYLWAVYGIAKTTMANEMKVSRDVKSLTIYQTPSFKDLGVQRIMYAHGTPDFTL